MITPVIPDTGALTLDELSDAVSALEQKINNTNIDELLYRAVVADTFEELGKFHLSVLQRILANVFRIKGLSGKEKRDYDQKPEQERLTEKNLTSGTVTISNIGSLYKEQKGYFGILEIIPPQIFAVGLGAVQEKPGVYVRVDGQKDIGIRKILPMCLVFDHRAVDFNAIVPFMKKLDEIFSAPGVIQHW
jgi:pyruvate dehydrogenase E2 component (dihydrolipoamide acetyltransferase)